MVLPLPLPSYSFRPIYCPWPIVKILGHNIGKMKKRAKIHGGSESIHYIKNLLFPTFIYSPYTFFNFETFIVKAIYTND